MWLQFPMREASEPLNAPGTWQHNCAFVWNAVFARQMALSLFGNQAAVEDLRNHVSNQNGVLAAGLAFHQNQQRLADGTRED